jgi:hypothetical protein
MRLMRRFPIFVVTLAILTLGLARPAAAAASVALHSTMIGANEVPGPGDPNASGSTVVVLNATTGMVCYTIKVQGISSPLTAGHIHVGPAGVAGPVVIPFPLIGGNNSFAGCTKADKMLVQAIINNPGGYYTNVHNAQFPGGVIRGQLSLLGSASDGGGGGL